MIKKLFIFIFLLFSFSAYGEDEIPSFSGFVNDHAGVISDKDKEKIEITAKELQEKTGAEIALLTVDSYEPFGSIEEFSMAVAEKWKTGSKKDEGVIIVLAMKERKIRIEIGYGLEGILPDGRVGMILDKLIIPYCRGGDFGPGLRRGVCRIAEIIGKDKGVELEENAKINNSCSEKLCMTIFSFIIFYIIFMTSLRIRKVRTTKIRYYGGSFGSNYCRYGGGNSFRGGGFRSGSFGGFGGGSFGGGGASRGF